MTTDIKNKWGDKAAEIVEDAINYVIETKKITAVPDADFDIFDYNPKEHDLWIAINALRTIVQEGYLPDHEWRLKEVATLLEKQL